MKDQRDAQRGRDRWYVVPSKGHAACDECGERIPAGAWMAYSHRERRSICRECADTLRLATRPSRAWSGQHAAPRAPVERHQRIRVIGSRAVKVDDA